MARALFRGIQLSDAERASVKAVREKYQPQFKALRESFKPTAQSIRAARQRGDTAAARAEWQKTAAQREQANRLLEQARSEYRAALTRENQAKFDANLSAVEKRVAKRASRVGKRFRGGVSRNGSGPRA